MGELPDQRHPDSEVARVIDWFRSQPDYVERLGRSIRRSLDGVIDGAHTGRYCVEQLAKTEKTYIGTRIEILVGHEFALEQGAAKAMDFVIEGIPVDCKWTIASTWSIPKEAIDHVCLLLKANDNLSTFDVAVARMTLTTLSQSQNRDLKRSLSSRSLEDSGWVIRSGALPPNVLLHLPAEDRNAILEQRSGQAKIIELFRRLQDQIIDREVVDTVAQQLDPAKRVRDARLELAKDGLVILGHQNADPGIARSLGLPIPTKGQWICTRWPR